MLAGRRSASISVLPFLPPSAQNQLTPLFPLHASHIAVSPLFPLDTRNSGGYPFDGSDKFSPSGPPRPISELDRTCATFRRLSIAVHQQDREPVVAFAIYRLQRRGAYTRLARRDFQKATNALNI